LTPLWRFYARMLPSGRLVWPAVGLTYAIAILVVFYGAGAPSHSIIYIDVHSAR